MNISQPNVQTTHQRVARAVVAHDVAEHLDHARRPKRLAWPENAEGSSSGQDAARGGSPSGGSPREWRSVLVTLRGGFAVIELPK